MEEDSCISLRGVPGENTDLAGLRELLDAAILEYGNACRESKIDAAVNDARINLRRTIGAYVRRVGMRIHEDYRKRARTGEA
jgi:hypothetical protein